MYGYWLVEISVWILVVLRLGYGYWLVEINVVYWLVETSVCILAGGDKSMDIGFITVSVWILVMWRQVYGYWLCGGKCMDIVWWR